MYRRAFFGVAVALTIIIATGAFAAGAFGGSNDADNDMERVPAPIEQAAAETPVDGTEYRVTGVAGLPGGCAEPAGYEIEPLGRTIRIEVYNEVPSDDRPCTKIYKTYPFSIGLGTDLQPGAEYTVTINGTVLTFVESVSQGSK